jgi:flagellar basal-body rod protein FlgF
LVRFADPQVLKNEGANLFASTAAAEPAGVTSRLEPGAIERSNVRPILEMSRLIEVNRNYTSAAGMVSRMDELRRTAIQRLADTA